MSKPSKAPKPEIQLAALSEVQGKMREELLSVAYETIAELTDNCAANVRDAAFTDAELARIFQKASDAHNDVARSRKWFVDLDVDKTSHDVFWVVAAQRADNKIQINEQILTRLSNTINTRALLNRKLAP